MGSMIPYLFLILSNVCIGMLIIYCMNEIFVGQLTKKLYTVFLEIIAIIGISAIYIITFKSGFVEMIILQSLTVIIYISIFYEELMLKKITEALVLISLLLTALSALDNHGDVISNLAGKEAEMWSLSAVFLLVLLSVAIRRRYEINLNDSELTVVLVSIIVVIFISISKSVTVVINEIDRSFGFILCLLFIMIAFQAVVGSICTTYQKKVDKWFLNLSYEQNISEVDRIQHMYDEARKLRHDIKHCIVSANYHIDHEEYSEAKQFLNNLIEEKVDAMGYVKYCNNRVLNYMINDKFEKCKRNDIETKCIVNGEINTISDLDMSILLGNLLDNAIEAAIQANPASVNLELYVDDNINIIIENSIKGTMINSKDAFVTTKQDKKKHGFGMQSIRDIVKKYNGTIHYVEENNRMVCRVVIHK
ncbi:sensor histidine kinase [[Clostridium] fimetarium]|uniref:GHKL domain-containing protein n=1 Tax=[Clostridium] fimetarium TaxID=99656 RepID=A0A1I0NKH3_9FIRM|nr:GHKL domain-containing protein [[Clostridium] fimetarium]SEW01819.1 GHKL domain-containing protein [[Clostridium] fimetarium]